MQFVPRTSFCQREAACFFKQARRVLQNPALDGLIAPRVSEQPKLLVVTAARIGNASDRNKVRRRIKALFHEFPLVDSSYDVAFIMKKPGIKLSFRELYALIESGLKQYAPVLDVS